MTVWRVPINLTWPGAGSPGVNVWSIRTTSEVQSDEVNLQEALDELHNRYTSFCQYMPSGSTAQLGDVVNRDTQEFGPGTWTKITSTNGSGQAPQALQMVISWRTALAARRGMGRTFIGPLGTNVMQSDGSISDTILTEVTGLAQGILNASTSGTNGWSVGVWGLQNKAPSGTTNYSALPHVHRDITGFRVRDKFGILRSRRD